MRIKKFLEMFDTEDLKSRHEIAYLSGNLRNVGSKIEYDFKNERIGEFIQKISTYHYPFFIAFDEANASEEGEVDFEDFKVYTNYNEEEGYWNFITAGERYLVTFGIKINKINDYDLYIYFDDSQNPNSIDEEGSGADFDGLTYDELIGEVKEIYIPFLEKGGFGKLVKYSSDLKNN